MYAPAVHDESTTLVNYVNQQLDAIRAASFGLTEEQARSTPCRSALSVSGIVKHITSVMRGVVTVLTATEPPRGLPSAAEFAEFLAGFALTDDETTVGTLRAFDKAREQYMATLAEVDPDAEILAPPAPWYGIYEPRPIRARYYLWHQVEEMARHAGHADIIREQLDGMAVPALVMTREGTPANDYFQPYTPPSGTIDV